MCKSDRGLGAMPVGEENPDLKIMEKRMTEEEARRRIEELSEKLAIAENWNRLVLEGASGYAYCFDLAKDVCTFSPKAVGVLPIDSERLENALDTYTSFVLPEDRESFLDSMAPFLRGESEYHKSEYRVRTKEGGVMWVSCHGKGTHDRAGKPLMLAGSMIDITQIKDSEERMRNLLCYDSLTGLKSRFQFDQDMEKRLEISGVKGSIVYVDINNFKMYNDIFGHQFGNLVLKNVADLLCEMAPDNLGIYRLGSDEFLIHMEQSKPQEIMEILSSIQEAIKTPRVIAERKIFLSVNVGIAIYPKNGDTAETILKNADIAMYAAARRGKENLTFFVDDGLSDLKKQYMIEEDVRNAINNDMEGFRLVYQPIVDASTGKWSGAEALLRYDSKVFGEIPVSEVVEMLESTTLIIPVGRWVMEKAIRECGKWHRNGFENGVIHVNCSGLQVNDTKLLEDIRKYLEEEKLDPGFLICELTETALTSSLESGIHFCQQLKDMGVRVSLDDFGTGYSSLNYLRRFPIHQIKIDKSFAIDYGSDIYNKVIISTIQRLARDLGLSMCVEGIESEETYIELEYMGVKQLQGFHFSRPIEAKAFMTGIESHILRDGNTNKLQKKT